MIQQVALLDSSLLSVFFVQLTHNERTKVHQALVLAHRKLELAYENLQTDTQGQGNILTRPFSIQCIFLWFISSFFPCYFLTASAQSTIEVLHSQISEDESKFLASLI